MKKIRIADFMKLSPTEKRKCTQKTYPCGRNKPEDAIEFDFGTFPNRECDSCPTSEIHYIVFGTSDEREPKFCRPCFFKMSEDTDFYIKEVSFQERAAVLLNKAVDNVFSELATEFKVESGDFAPDQDQKLSHLKSQIVELMEQWKDQNTEDDQS